MSNITIKNKNALDLNFLSVLGVSVKESDSPIGMFGTGLKYAIAVLLRNGVEVELTIKTGDKISEYTIRTNTTIIRGQAFNRCILCENDWVKETLPFTTDLGKNWLVLSALRELWSNARDEGKDVAVDDDWTEWRLSGEALENYSERDVFLPTEELELILSTPYCDVYRGSTHKLYYRGVVVFDARQTEYSFSYIYNIKSTLMLTEDRTVNVMNFDCLNPLKHTLRELTYAGFTKHMSDAREVFENRTKWADFGTYLTDFEIPIVRKLLATFETAHEAGADCINNVVYLRKLLNGADKSYTEIPITAEQLQMLTHAMQKLAKDCPITQPIKITDELTHNRHAAYDHISQIIWLSSDCFKHGERWLIRALLEEQTHHDTGFEDETRELQNYIFDRWLDKILA